MPSFPAAARRAKAALATSRDDPSGDPVSVGLVWGWVRMALGMTQIALSAYALVLIASAPEAPQGWAFGAAALSALVASRVLYRGQKAPPR